MELISREEVNRLLHNQREMQSRVNQLPTYDACYLGSPCEYQNEDIKMLNPHPPVQCIAEIKISENEMEEIVKKAAQRLKDSEWHTNNVVEDTCTNDGKDCSEYDQFVCSKCGIELLDWTRYIGDECYEYAFKFCPNCGRKIVEGAEDGND